MKKNKKREAQEEGKMKNVTFDELCGLIDRALLAARMKVRRFEEQAENRLEWELFDSFELAICDLRDANNRANWTKDWLPLIEALKTVGLEFTNQEEAIEFIKNIARERSEEELSETSDLSGPRADTPGVTDESDV